MSSQMSSLAQRRFVSRLRQCHAVEMPCRVEPASPTATRIAARSAWFASGPATTGRTGRAAAALGLNSPAGWSQQYNNPAGVEYLYFGQKSVGAAGEWALCRPPGPGFKQAITTWAEHWNTDPAPFVWKAAAEQIIAKVQRGRTTLHQIKNQTNTR
jgi:hypothetical protein